MRVQHLRLQVLLVVNLAVRAAVTAARHQAARGRQNHLCLLNRLPAVRTRPAVHDRLPAAAVR